MKEKSYSVHHKTSTNTIKVLLPAIAQAFLLEYYSDKSPNLLKKVLPRVNGRVSTPFWNIHIDVMLEEMRKNPPRTTRNS